MSRQKPKFEIADIFREYYYDLPPLSKEQRKVVNAILNCRTSALGGHELHCSCCPHTEKSYNSCGNRHCPKCGALAREKWLNGRMQDLLPVPYFHVVFTVPRELNNLFLWNRRKMYSLLLKIVSRTIIDSAGRNLGIQPGMLKVLHTWGQNLDFHPHVHCIVYGGGLRDNKWISSKKDFYIHVKKFSRLFRGKFLAALKKMSKSGGLRNPEKDPTPFSFEQFIPLAKEMYKKEWVVYSKKPFGGPEQVLKYLSRYTHRVAISNYRLKDISGGNITFTWKDYRTCKRKVMKLSAREFMRRFLLHVLPRGFVKIRSCGFLNNRIKKAQLALCRNELGVCQTQTASCTIAADILENAKINFTNRQICPLCKTGILIITKIRAFYESNFIGGCAPPCRA